ncbi:AAA family ATPase, partial [Limnoraphis robusta]|nr:AAA family ATPase [Limnoraphis robusta]
MKKKNVRSLIENGVFSYYNDVVQIANQINVCSDLYGYPKSQKKRSPQDTTTPPPPPRHDLSQAPENSRRFCDRTQELATLKQWILEEHSR